MGIDPVTHKPKNDALLSSSDNAHSKTASNLSHMAQWESARLEAEARLVRESKIRSHNSLLHHNHLANSSHLKGWNINLESPTSTLSFNENVAPIMNNGENTKNGNEKNNNNDDIDNNAVVSMIEFVGTNSSSIVKEEGGDDQDQDQWKGYESSLTFTSNLHHELTMSMDQSVDDVIAEEGFTNLLLKTNSEDLSLSESGGESNNGGDGGSGSEFYEDNNNYWNNILNLVNSSPSDSPMF